MGKLSKLTKEIREDGFGVIWRRLSWRLPRSVFYYNHSNHIRFDLNDYKPKDLPDLEIRMATLDDYELFEKVRITHKTFKQRLDRGDMCAMVVVDGLVRSFMWAAEGNIYIHNSGAILDVGEDGFYSYDAYTDPEFRGKGFFKYCDEIQNRHYKETGKRYHYVSIDKFNKLSNMIRRRAGYKYIGETIHYSLFGLRITSYKNWFRGAPGVKIFGKNSVSNLKTV